jgi:hypothetical protein
LAASIIRTTKHRQYFIEAVIAQSIADDRSLFEPLDTHLESVKSCRDDTIRGFVSTFLKNNHISHNLQINVTSFQSYSDLLRFIEALEMTVIPVEQFNLNCDCSSPYAANPELFPNHNFLSWKEKTRFIAQSCLKSVSARESFLLNDNQVELIAWPRELHINNASDIFHISRAIFGWRYPSNLMLVPSVLRAFLHQQHDLEFVSDLELPADVSVFNADISILGNDLTSKLEICETLWSESNSSNILSLSNAWYIAQKL